MHVSNRAYTPLMDAVPSITSHAMLTSYSRYDRTYIYSFSSMCYVLFIVVLRLTDKLILFPQINYGTYYSAFLFTVTIIELRDMHSK